MPWKKNNPGCPCCEPCEARICVLVTDGCPTPHAVAGATVTATKGGTTYGPCTTDSAGSCCFDIDQPGSYTVTATVGGLSKSTTATVVCGVDNGVSLAFTTNTTFKVVVNVNLCGSNGLDYASCLVEIIQGGGTIFSAAPNSSGVATFWGVPAGVATSLRVTLARYQTYTTAVGLGSGCGTTTVNVSLTPAAGYQCVCSTGTINCFYPASETLPFTDSLVGSGTATYSVIGGIGRWRGTISGYNWPGNGTCPAATFDVNYEFQGCTLIVSWITHSTGPPAFTFCPGGGAITSTGSANGGSPTFACPPAYGTTFTMPGSGIYFGLMTPATVTFTE